MGWLDAHDSYVMDIVARDRMDELRSTAEVATSHIERTTAPAAVAPEARDRAIAGVVLCHRALAKASR